VSSLAANKFRTPGRNFDEMEAEGGRERERERVRRLGKSQRKLQRDEQREREERTKLHHYVCIIYCVVLSLVQYRWDRTRATSCGSREKGTSWKRSSTEYLSTSFLSYSLPLTASESNGIVTN